MAPTFLQLDFSRVSELTFLIVVFSILFVDVFDNAGTLIGVTHRTGLMKNGKLARMKQALISDSFAAMFGALIGTSTTTSYIESAAGVSAGGRTGLTAAFVGLFFLLALFPSLLRKLPRSGGWLNSIKVVMGFLELAAALKFFRTAELRLLPQAEYFTYDFVLCLWVALSLVCGLYLLSILLAWIFGKKKKTNADIPYDLE